MPISTGMPAVPPEILAAAKKRDEVFGAALADSVPTPMKPYNAKAVTALAKAISEVARLFGLRIEPKPYTAPLDRLTPDLARVIAMITAAAKEYGQPLPVELKELRGDTELTALTAAISTLAKDTEFRDFLNKSTPEEKKAGVEIEVKIGKGDEEEMMAEEELYGESEGTGEGAEMMDEEEMMDEGEGEGEEEMSEEDKKFMKRMR